MRTVLSQINPVIGDLPGNIDKIMKAIAFAKKTEARLVLFPELAITGYPPEDFLLLTHFVEASEKALEHVIKASRGLSIIIGLPRFDLKAEEKKLYNSAAIIQDGALIGFQDKRLLPTYDVFDERRYFSPGKKSPVWEIDGKKVGITICEDIWQHSQAIPESNYPFDPIDELKDQNLDLLINIAASPFCIGKFEERLNVCQKAVKTTGAPLLFCNQVGGNDSLIFDGLSLALDESGKLVDFAPGFIENHLIVDVGMNHQIKMYEQKPMESVYRALVLGVRDYFKKSGFTRACLGLSGGIDSAVVAAIAKEALGKENVLALMMPSRYSSKESTQDAEQLIKNLGILSETISIEPLFKESLKLLTERFEGEELGVTEENLQPRIRSMILMAFSNQKGHIVLSTGNKSEMAMGYATLYGDMTGGLAVLSDVTKGQVYALAEHINQNGIVIPENILKKDPTAELRPNQKDTDTLPEYDIVDTVVEEYIENHLSPDEIADRFDFDPKLVESLIFRIHQNEYKRRQGPPGLRVSKRAFSIGRRFPIVQGWS